MKNLVIYISVVLFIAACTSSKKKEGNVTVTGTIKGLKQGTLYLQKIEDSTLTTVDSLIVDGDPNFTLYSTITEPEIHYLYLDKNDNAPHNDRIDFFAEKGTINIVTTLNDFERDAKITGGKNTNQLQEYKAILRRFNDRNLRLIKENYEAQKQNDQIKLMALEKEYKKLIKSKYLYTINFAVNNKDLEVAPYVTLLEVFDANVKYLDTVVDKLTPKVKKSMYGKQLIDFVAERKAIEKKQPEAKDKVVDTLQSM
ncbi:DUF4369 domain-containing protein [Aquimarina brevivitae]|uniref:Uncharacterized protein DUF4369 n=1 Tax=Aquimarina brevivitae TaxID=323412 RepID=A0A4Q7P1C0_9FLAO|nr:DUF4369 domain-containing protein [Aquimarina brevivitae]RZS93108.1 uncharacterized protein DUF4369 [Aquimarina brevivitae]